MIKIIEGVYRNGKIELPEVPGDIRDETRVFVTFVEPGIDALARARELRARLTTFAEDWESPDMDIYDNYDFAKSE